MDELADERVVEYEVGEARLRLDGRERTTLIVFGPDDAAPLLGATSLELFNLGVDPVGQSLVPVPGLLKEEAAPHNFQIPSLFGPVNRRPGLPIPAPPAPAEPHGSGA